MPKSTNRVTYRTGLCDITEQLNNNTCDSITPEFSNTNRYKCNENHIISDSTCFDLYKLGISITK